MMVNGTRISSNNDIVVNSGSWLAGSPGGTDAGRDIGIDQIAPIEETGFEYILIKGEGTANEKCDHSRRSRWDQCVS